MNKIEIHKEEYFQVKAGTTYIKSNTLTNHQIATAFGPTLSLIYKNKMAEINAELQPIYNHLDTLDVPKYTDFDRWFARSCIETVYPRIKLLFESIDHINKIRRLSKKMKDMPDDELIEWDRSIERAKQVPILDITGGALKRGGMTACPFHTDKTPSAKINKNNTLKCFSCQFFGDSISVWMKLNGTSFRESVKAINNL